MENHPAWKSQIGEFLKAGRWQKKKIPERKRKNNIKTTILGRVAMEKTQGPERGMRTHVKTRKKKNFLSRGKGAQRRPVEKKRFE